MSTLKSADEHLTLNADGTSKNILFQADGVQKASISSAGLFTSTTIDATVLTGNLPAISGASLTGLGQVTAKAWVNFNGSGTVAIRDSYNVSSITDEATGKYTVNIDVDMADTNYATFLTIDDNYYGGIAYLNNGTGGATTGTILLRSKGNPHTDYPVDVDADTYNVLIFGD